MSDLKISKNVDPIENEIVDNKFILELSDHIIHIKSFIDPDDCKSIISSLDNNDLDKSAPYTEGLLNDETDSFFDPDIDAVERVKQKVFTDGLKIYADKVRSFNWSYYDVDKFHCSEMIVRRYHPKSEFEYHYDDIIEEIFPQWFMRRKNILTCNVYFNDETEYEGGDLHFASTNDTFRPSMGDIVLFPSNWMFYHKVKEITSGIRYSGTFWFYYGSNRRIGKGKRHQELFSK